MASAARREKAWTGAAYAALKAERRDLGAGKRALETLAGAGAALCAQILRRWCVQPANALSTPQRSARLRCVPMTILTDVPLARSLGRVPQHRGERRTDRRQRRLPLGRLRVRRHPGYCVCRPRRGAAEWRRAAERDRRHAVVRKFSARPAPSVQPCGPPRTVRSDLTQCFARLPAYGHRMQTSRAATASGCGASAVARDGSRR
jgi:hypothetical protein